MAEELRAFTSQVNEVMEIFSRNLLYPLDLRSVVSLNCAFENYPNAPGLKAQHSERASEITRATLDNDRGYR
jgi:hypothetical protein